MQVVNELTGELVEIPTNDELKDEMNLIVTDDVLDKLYQIQALQEQIDSWKFETKEKIKELFKKYDVKSFKNNYIEITYVAPTTQKRVDTALLKKANIYDQFCKDVEVKESLRVKVL